jgi:serine protease Do
MSSSPEAKPATNKKQNHEHSLFSIITMSVLFGFLGGFLATSLIAEEKIVSSTDNVQIVSAESEAITEIAREVSPSVVSIAVETTTTSSFFFRDFVQEGAGTGIILTEDGLILTNRHVVPEGATNVTIILSDGTQYDDVEVVDRDAFNDVAFLQINDANGLTPAKLGDSSVVEVGNKAIAIGNALGQYANTVTSGIISGIGRPVVASDGDSYDSLNNLFQTDASINPGNSGGPLVNINGEVIGLNTAVAGNAENIGFAIPINDIKSAIVSVQEQGRIVKPYLGVRYISLTPDVAEALELSVSHGAYLATSSGDAVVPDSPAEKAGLREEDIITKVNDKEIDESNTLSTLLSEYAVGDEVALTVMRGEEELIIKATLEEAPDTI